MVDPLARRRQYRPNNEVIPPVDIAEVMALMLELAPLRDLPWAPLAERIELLGAAMRGGEGVGPGLVVQLRRWAGAWGKLHQELREFYQRNAQNPAAEAAIWRVLEGGRMVGPLRGQLENLWIDQYGRVPGRTLVPDLSVPMETNP